MNKNIQKYTQVSDKSTVLDEGHSHEHLVPLRQGRSIRSQRVCMCSCTYSVLSDYVILCQAWWLVLGDIIMVKKFSVHHDDPCPTDLHVLPPHLSYQTWNTVRKQSTHTKYWSKLNSRQTPFHIWLHIECKGKNNPFAFCYLHYNIIWMARKQEK